MEEREQSKTRRRNFVRLGIRLGLVTWMMAAAVWILGAGEEVIPIGTGENPSVASDNLDHAVVAWQSASSHVEVQALGMGVLVGGPIRISSSDAAQANAAAAHLKNDEFVVAWQEEGETGAGILARRVRVEDEPIGSPQPSMGVLVGGPIRISSAGILPAVDADDEGDFVVAWTAPALPPPAQGDPGGNHQHFAIRTTGMGVLVGGPIRIGARSLATPPALAVRGGGDFLVAWEDAAGDISAALVGEDGDVVRDDLRVNESRLGRQSVPAVTVPLDGKFTVVWQRKLGQGEYHVVGRRLGPDSTPLGGEFEVSLTPSVIPVRPAVAADPWGRTLATWTSQAAGSSERLILGRQLGLGTAPQGAVGGVLTLAGPNAVVSKVHASSNEDDFVVVWESQTESGVAAGNRIATRFVMVPLP